MLRGTALLLFCEAVAFGSFTLEPNNLGHIFDAVDDPFHLADLIQERRVQGTPISFFEAAVTAGQLHARSGAVLREEFFQPWSPIEGALLG